MSGNQAGEARERRVGRRRLIVGAAAAGAGAAAGVLGAAAPASAATGKPVLLGKANTATGATSITASAGDGVDGHTSANGKSGVAGTDASKTGGTGVTGTSTAGRGVYGTTAAGNQPAVEGVNTNVAGGYGVIGSAGGGYGVSGVAVTGTGVYGSSEGDGYGVQGVSANGTGIYGTSTHGTGITGTTSADSGTAVYGQDNSSGGGYGVTGISINGTGVYASSATGTGPGLLVEGNANVIGTLSKSGGSFRIDHPLDPAGKYLYHSFVESPDMKNVYDGTAVLDAHGSAEVTLPDWFEALNRDYRYQLTALDAPAPGLHIAARMDGGRFTIAGGGAGQEVSWQVTGTRQDAWANAHRIPVEVDKPAEDRGRYLHPSLFPGGQPVTELALPRPLPAPA